MVTTHASIACSKSSCITQRVKTFVHLCSYDIHKCSNVTCHHDLLAVVNRIFLIAIPTTRGAGIDYTKISCVVVVVLDAWQM